MLITRESDYALRIIRSLSKGGSMTTSQIADKQQIPQQFAYKIIRKLKTAGIIDVARGVDGGCTLARDLDDLSLYDLLMALDTKTSVNSCTEPNYNCPWKEDNGGCSINSQLSDLQERLDMELKDMTIASMMPEDASD